MNNFINTLSYMKRYKTKSIHLRNLLLIEVLIIIPIIILSTLLFGITTSNINKEIKNANISVLERTRDDIEAEFQKIEELFYLIASDSNINALRTQDKIKALTFEHYEKLMNVFSIFRMASALNPNISYFYVYFRNSFTIVDSNGYITPLDEFGYADTITRFLPISKETGTKLNHKIYLHRNDSDKGNPENYFYIGHNIPIYENENTVLFAIHIDERIINSILNKNSSKNNLENMILDPDGIIICHENQDRIHTEFDKTIFSKLNGVEGFHIGKEFGVRKAWISVTSPVTGWKYVSVVSLESLYSNINQYKSFFILITIIVIFTALVFSLLITSKISEPINTLMTIINSNNDWFPEEWFSKIKFAEIKSISANLLTTYRERSELKNTLEQRVNLLKKAQFFALQSQINPHFIYNTLDSINWSIREKLGLENELSNLINSLSEILRFNLGDEDNLTGIANEISYLESYIRIQLFRYSNSFRVECHMPEYLYQYKIIKITLQPIVENSIGHGLKHKKDGGIIRIEGRLDGDEIIITIWDNGKGIEESYLEEIRRSLYDNNINIGDSIGLKNVNFRYKILFGEQYGISIDSICGAGTRITLRFPAIPLSEVV